MSELPVCSDEQLSVSSSEEALFLCLGCAPRRDAPLYSLFKVFSALPMYHHQCRLLVVRFVSGRKPRYS